MNYKKKSKEWYERALDEKDEFVKFVLMYIALEVITKSNFSHIRKITHDRSIRTNFYNRIDLKYLEELKNKLEINPLQNMDPNGDHRWSGKLSDVNDFEGIVEFLIRARNNLFHGDKGLDEKRDQFIVTEGNIILEPLLTAMV